MSLRKPLDARAWDQIAGLIGLAFGAFVIALGSRLAFGAWNNPGPGMMPVLIGVFIACLSAGLFVSALGRRGDEQPGPNPWLGARWRLILTSLVALLIYAAVLDALGYVVATFLLLVVLLRLVEPPAWITTIVSSALITGATYGLFVKLLQVQLPRAAWGF